MNTVHLYFILYLYSTVLHRKPCCPCWIPWLIGCIQLMEPLGGPMHQKLRLMLINILLPYENNPDKKVRFVSFTVHSVTDQKVHPNHRIIVDRIEKSTYNGKTNWAQPALAHPPTTPSPHARPGVGYICGLWVLPGRYNRQSKRSNADCAQFVFPLYSFIFCHL